MFEAAQYRLKNNRGALGKHEYLLSRRVTCEYNNKLVGLTAKGKYRYYAINRSRFLPKAYYTCKGVFHCDTLDSAIWLWVTSLICDTERVLSAYQQLQEEQIASSADTIETIRRFDDSIASAEKELAYLIEEAREFRDNPRVKEQSRQMIKDQTAKIDALTAERNRLALPLKDSILIDAQIAGAVQFFEELSVDLDALNALPMSEKRNIQDMLNIQVITYANMSYIDIIWRSTSDRVKLNGVSRG